MACGLKVLLFILQSSVVYLSVGTSASQSSSSEAYNRAIRGVRYAWPDNLPSTPPSTSPALNLRFHNRAWATGEELGIKVCRLKGTINGTCVLLNLYLKAIHVSFSQQGHHGQQQGQQQHTYEIKGFMFMDEAGRYTGTDDWHIPYPLNAYKAFSKRVYLRSHASGRTWDMPTHTPSRKHGQMAIGPLRISLTPEEAVLYELEVRVPDVPFFCHLALPSQPAYPPMAAKNNTFATTASKNTTVVMMMPPAYGMAARVTVDMLLLHMAWHSRLGVHRYIMYITEQREALQADLRVQILHAQRRLLLVHWDELPLHEQQLYHPHWMHDMYAGQIVIQNHNLLSVYGDDAIVLSWDMDEFLMTPKPGICMIQVWNSCGAQGVTNLSLQAAVSIPRYSMGLLDLQHQAFKQLPALTHPLADHSEIVLWLHFLHRHVIHNPAQQANQTSHPLHLYHMREFKDNKWQYKAAGDAGSLHTFDVHWGEPVQPKRSYTTSTLCARLAHIVTLWRARNATEEMLNPVTPFNEDPAHDWWWTVR